MFHTPRYSQLCSFPHLPPAPQTSSPLQTPSAAQTTQPQLLPLHPIILGMEGHPRSVPSSRPVSLRETTHHSGPCCGTHRHVQATTKRMHCCDGVSQHREGLRACHGAGCHKRGLGAGQRAVPGAGGVQGNVGALKQKADKAQVGP